MNVLSLFDGISCGQIALNRVGIKYENYYASEIDKFAIKCTQENYPNTIQLGDISNWKSWDIDWPKIGLVTGGFPCQAWSLAGKQLGDKDERGKLFWVMLDVIKHVMANNPEAKFLIENVKMKKEFEQYITYHTEQSLGKVEKHLINSALVSAQNRNRYYWTNIQNVTQPEDKGILLKDILEDGDIDRDKSHCLDANYFKGGNLKSYFKKGRRQLVFTRDGLCQVGEADLKGHDSIKRVYYENGKSPTLTTMGGGHREPKIATVIQVNPYKKAGNKQPHMQDRVYSEDGKSVALANEFASRTNTEVNIEDYKQWRKLTPLECERLQTVPENYTSVLSNTQRYKCLGNGWTVDVVAHIFQGLKQ